MTITDSRRPASSSVELATTAPYLGGTRRWFVCPVTGARCRILYLVEGRWVSRRAFRGADRKFKPGFRVTSE